MIGKKCKICRRAGAKLLLKGERCFSANCSFIKKPYAPGTKAGGRPKGLSEYGKQLKEKQKLRNIYGLREAQFSKYVKTVLGNRNKTENPAALVVQVLEDRLDNVVFRLGFAPSRTLSRQLVNHNHFTVNGKRVDIPSFKTKKGDIIAVKASSVDTAYFKNILTSLKKYKTPTWLKLDADKLEGEILGEAIMEEVALPVEISSIFEYYSR
jgi:small subunit ribosomal protein S4